MVEVLYRYENASNDWITCCCVSNLSQMKLGEDYIKILTMISQFSRIMFIIRKIRSTKSSGEILPLGQCFCHVRLVASPSTAPEIRHQGYKHHSYLSIYVLENTLDLGNPAKSKQLLRYLDIPSHNRSRSFSICYFKKIYQLISGSFLSSTWLFY